MQSSRPPIEHRDVRPCRRRRTGGRRAAPRAEQVVVVVGDRLAGADADARWNGVEASRCERSFDVAPRPRSRRPTIDVNAAMMPSPVCLTSRPSCAMSSPRTISLCSPSSCMWPSSPSCMRLGDRSAHVGEHDRPHRRRRVRRAGRMTRQRPEERVQRRVRVELDDRRWPAPRALPGARLRRLPGSGLRRGRTPSRSSGSNQYVW